MYTDLFLTHPGIKLALSVLELDVVKKVLLLFIQMLQHSFLGFNLNWKINLFLFCLKYNKAKSQFTYLLGWV